MTFNWGSTNTSNNNNNSSSTFNWGGGSSNTNTNNNNNSSSTFNWGSSNNNSSNNNNNNNNNNTSSGGFNWGSSNTNNNNNSSNNNTSSFGFGNNTNNNNNNNNNNNSSWNFNSNNNNNQQNNNNNRPQQFVTPQTRFASLQNDKKQMFGEFENKIVKATQRKKQELNETIKKLEQLPDISHSLRMYGDQTLLLTEKIGSYKHDLEPFTNKLKKEFVYASQVQVDVQRQSAMSMSMQLPPPFYWDKVKSFQQQLTELRKQLEALQQHLNDAMNNGKQSEVISTKSVTNALNASHRSTLNIAAQVITNHNAIQKLKEEYKKFRLQHFADSHDPFNDKYEKKGSVAKIEQYVNKGLELKGLQYIPTNMNNNNNNQNVNNSNGNSNNFGNNNNNQQQSNNNGNSNNTSFNWGGSSNNNNNSSGFNFGGSNNNNSSSNTNTTFSWG